MIGFEVPGPVRGKGRPRFARVGAGVRTFTDAKTQSYEALVKQCAAIAHRAAALEGPVAVTIAVHQIPPASWSKTKRERALAQLFRPTGKPDLDNIAKAICDSLNGIIWKDDAQVTELHVSKHWSGREFAHVSIKPVEAW